jgi:type II secretory pathway component PulM
VTQQLGQLPRTRAEAAQLAKDSPFVRSVLPQGIIDALQPANLNGVIREAGSWRTVTQNRIAY